MTLPAGVMLAAFDANGAPILADPGAVQDDSGQSALASEVAANASIAAAAVQAVEASLRTSIATVHAESQGLLAEVGAAAQVLTGQMAQARGAIGLNTASIESETVTRASEDSALSGRIDTVTATAGSNSAGITSEAATRAGADEALGTEVSQVSGVANGAAAGLTSESSARATSEAAIGARIDRVTATAGSNAVAISSETAARADGDSALGGQISSVSATLGSVSATVSSQQAALVDVQGRLVASWQVVETLPGGVARLALTSTNGSSSFVVDAANMLVSGNLIVGGSLQTGSLANNAVTNVQGNVSASRTVPFSATQDSPFDGILVTNSSPTGALIRIDFTTNAFVAYNYTPPGSSAPPNGFYALFRRQNGTDTNISGWQSTYVFGGIPRLILDTPATGSPVSYLLRYATDAGAGASGSYPVTGEQIVVMEIKR